MSNPRDPDTLALSPAGAARRETILAELHDRLRTQRRRAAAVRLAGASAALSLAAAASWWILARPAVAPVQPIAVAPAPQPRPTDPSPTPPEPPPPAGALVHIVTTASLPLAPCAGQPPATSPAPAATDTPFPGICTLSDEQLLAALAEAEPDAPARGLVRIGDRVLIVPVAVR